jgi:hypothetical protein
MKRKVKKFGVGGETEYDQEDTGLFGGKIKYRTDPATGNKYVAGKANPFDRNPAEQRYYSVNDVKGKLGMGSKEDKKPTETYIDKQMKRYADMPDVQNVTPEVPKGIASGFKSDQSVFKRQDNEVSLPNKAVSISKEKTTVTAPSLAKSKVGKGYEDVTRSLRGSEKVGKGYEGLDLRDKKSSTDGLGTAAAVLAGLGGLGLAGMKSNMKNSKDARSSLRKGIKAIDPSQPDYLDQARFADEGNPNYKRGGKVKAKSKMSYGGKVKKMASGGKAKSASARADGCAIRGKTRA